ncbi:MAG: hypothetical protein Kow0067_00040 [Coriobacteriia bacterium]
MPEETVQDAGRDETAPPRKKTKKRWIVVGVLAALVVVGVAAFEYTSTPGFCESCHEIAPSVEGWRASAHAQDDAADCMDCHADAGFVGELVTHIGGIQEAYVHITESPEEGDIRGEVPAERCVRCHEDAWDDEAFAAEHPTPEAPCGVCHRDSAHTNPKPLYEAADAEGGE